MLMQTVESEVRSPPSGRAVATAQAKPLKDYSVLLGLAAVGSVLFLQSVGARLANEIGAWLHPVTAAPH